MTKRTLRSPVRTAALALLSAVVLGVLSCESSEEAEFRKASQALRDARSRVDAGRTALEEAERDVHEASTRLAATKKKMDEANQALKKAEARIDRAATDEVLFRSLQRALLDDRGLSDAAITVRVEDRVVTLGGQAGTPELRDRALQLVRSTPGVRSVVDQIHLPSGRKAGPDAGSGGSPPPGALDPSS